MKSVWTQMGMPITLEIIDKQSTKKDILKIVDYFKYIDETFSTYKDTSEISKINRGELSEKEYSSDMKKIFELAEKTKQETNGYFDINNNGSIDPSGIVKGWAIYQAYHMLLKCGLQNFYLDVGSDIQVAGVNTKGKNWTVGIKNPFNVNEIVKIIKIKDKGVATSGNYLRGNHVYNPKNRNKEIESIVSLTVIGPNVFEADRFATAAFAMGEKGINFIEQLNGFDGYQINDKGIATFTSHFEEYVV